MAGRKGTPPKATVFVQTPGVKDPELQRAFDVVNGAIKELQARQLATVSAQEVIAAGISESDVIGLVADLAARPTGSGTANKVTKWTGSSTLGDSVITDTGALVTVANAFKVTGAADFDSTVNVDGAATFNANVTLSTFTQGSLLFTGAGGLVSQDNANLYWDDTDNWMGIGLGNHVRQDNTAFPGGGTISTLEVERSGNNAFINAVVFSNTAGNHGQFVGIHGRGTRGSPSAVVANDYLASFGGSGYNDPTVNRFAGGAAMRIIADGTWTTTSFPTRITFDTCDVSETTQTSRMTIMSDGRVLIGTTTASNNSVVGGSTFGTVEVEKNSGNATIMASPFSATAGHAGIFLGIRGRGSRSSPGAVSNGDALLYIQAGGYFNTTANNFGVGGQIQFFADGNWTGTSKGVRITFNTIANGSAASANRMTLTSDGSLIVGAATAKTKTALTSSLEVTRDASSQLVVSAYGTGVVPELNFWSGRGTAASSSALSSGDSVGQISFTGSTAATTGFSGAIIRAAATQGWSATLSGTKLEFLTTPDTAAASRAVRVTIDQDGTTTFANNTVTTGRATFNSGTIGTYTPGSYTVPTGYYSSMTKRLTLTTTQRVTLAGTARLSIRD